MLLRICIAALFASSLFAQSLQPPQALTVVTATNKKVQLSWTGGDTAATGYTIERKTLNGTYSPLLNMPAPATAAITANDTNFDPYTAYVYRVRATAAGNQSDVSNEVTVRPVPYGYNIVLPSPSGLISPNNFGASTRMILDSSGDPAIAYTWNDPNEDNDFSDSALYFVRWDRAHYQWTAAVKIAPIGDVNRYTLVPVSIAQDPSNNMFGIAYEDESKPDVAQISLALSNDGGKTWNVQSLGADGADSYQRPVLAMGGGNVHVAFYHDYDGIRYVTGKETDDPKNWTSTLVPLPVGYTNYSRYASLALDSAGKPGIAMVVYGDNGPAEAFWRPGGNAVLVADDNGHQNDVPEVRLSFFRTSPRIAYAGAIDDNYYADYDHLIWVMNSTDDGNTWLSPMNVRSDGNRDLTGPIDLATGSRGQAAITTEDNGGNGDGVVCGQPKLARSNDLVMWTTCGTSSDGSPNATAGSPTIAFAGNDTLILAFQQTSTSSDLPQGIVLWRQPPDWVFPPSPQN